jgi:hypothetical protein
MNYLTNWEADEDDMRELKCDRCGEMASRLEAVGECETAEDWCLSCLKEEAERMREEEDRDAEMRSLKGYYSSELDRI